MDDVVIKAAGAEFSVPRADAEMQASSYLKSLLLYAEALNVEAQPEQLRPALAALKEAVQTYTRTERAKAESEREVKVAEAQAKMNARVEDFRRRVREAAIACGAKVPPEGVANGK